MAEPKKLGLAALLENPDTNESLEGMDAIPAYKRTPEQYVATLGERFGIWMGADFATQEFPPRDPILGPWLVKQSLTMLFAERGLGKSMFLLGMALAIAKGESFLDYPANQPMSVLYVDGEMPPSLMQERLNLLSGGNVPSKLTIINAPSAQDATWADFNEEDGRRTLDEIISVFKPQVVILDNKSTLMPPKNENDAESWVDIQNWLINLRQRGLAVILVHHAGKSGKPRGTSMMEVVVDTIIQLGRYGQQGQSITSFTMGFEKARHLYGEDVVSKIIKLDTRSGAALWSAETVEAPENLRKAEAIKLAAEGLSQRQIAERLSVSLGTINNWLNSK